MEGSLADYSVNAGTGSAPERMLVDKLRKSATISRQNRNASRAKMVVMQGASGDAPVSAGQAAGGD
jgi:hypothetical protein